MGKIKFKLSVKELSFEFEGDQETGQRFQNSISKTLNSLTDTPNHVIDVEARQINDIPKLLEGQNGNSSSSKTRRRKSKKVPTASQNGEAGESDEASRPRSKRTSIKPLYFALIREGFFDNKRGAGDIRQELSKKGFNFEANEVSAHLLPLTQSGYLSRDDSSGKWEYWKGNVDVPTES